MTDFHDPAERAALIERVGLDEYERQLQAFHAKSVIEVVNGHALRQVKSGRFGPLVAVGDTGRAFTSLAAARKFAREHPANNR